MAHRHRTNSRDHAAAGPSVPSRHPSLLLFCLGFGLLTSTIEAPPIEAQPSFSEHGGLSGLDDASYEIPIAGFGAGMVAADFDDDGFVDLFLVTKEDVPHRLYRNLGNGSFQELAGEVGLGDLDPARAALWFDADGDGRLDLLTSRDCYQADCAGIESALRLYRQGVDGSFSDVTAAAGLLVPGLTDERHSGGLAASDFNGDGYLDIASAFWEGHLTIYLNQGDGSFGDMTGAIGIDDAVLGYYQPVPHDFDQDGDVDLFVSIDFTENRLWLNQGWGADGVPVFVERAGELGCDNAMNDMGVALGDYDDDGDADLYVTNIYRDGRHNVLLRNDLDAGTLSFSEVSGPAGVQDGAWGWGTSFADLDNDGDLDIAEVNGWHTNTWYLPSRLFMHQGTSPPTFVDQAAAAGLTDASWGSSLLAFDYDLDGDVDLIENISKAVGSSPRNQLRLHRNELAGGQGTTAYLIVRPRQGAPNHQAIGAKVELHAAGVTKTRWIGAGSSFLGQEPAEAFFGLADASGASRLDITWPGGRQTRRTDVALNRVIEVSQAEIFANGFESGDLTSWSAAVP